MYKSVSELNNLLQGLYISENGMLLVDPLPIWIKICELFEAESKKCSKKHPDTFHGLDPSRINPTCVLGQLYGIMTYKNSSMIKSVINHLQKHYFLRETLHKHNLNVAACRLIMNLMPYLETTNVFRNVNNQLIQRLFTWAENTNEPLQTYAMGLLASCMKFRDIDENLKEHNKLVTIILDRVHSYYTQLWEENKINQSTQSYQITNSDQPNDNRGVPSSKIKKNGICGDSNSSSPESNANNWIQIYPPTLTTKLICCLQYLEKTVKYQQFFEKYPLNLAMKIINSSENQNVYLTFEALRFLASLISHKKFGAEFIGSQGLQKLLLVPKLGILSTGVSICFHNLSYSEEAMEMICLLPKHVLVDLVKYALWMLECSIDDCRCNATMFFRYSYHFRIIKEIFDNHDGLHKLLNGVNELPIYPFEYPGSLIRGAKLSARNIIYTICCALKKYLEVHLHIKVQEIRKAKMGDSGLLIASKMSSKKSHAEVQEEIELLSNYMSLKNHWTPVDQLLKLGGLNFLLKIISVSMKYDWHTSKTHDLISCEIIKNVLEVINICAVLPKVQLALCEIPSPKVAAYNQNVTTTEEENFPQVEYDRGGLEFIIKAAKGDYLNADVQKAALSVIITCVCAPIHREGGSITYYSSHGSNKKQTPMTYEIEKVWDCFRYNNGLIVLLTLITIETSNTEVDAIRGLACRALAGLARNQSVLQILSKLPLFNSGQLQSFIQNPVSLENRQEHATFRKYATELLGLVLKENKAKIDEEQFHLFLYQFLKEKGMSRTAEILLQETNDTLFPLSVIGQPSEEYCQLSSRETIRNRLANSSNGPFDAGSSHLFTPVCDLSND